MHFARLCTLICALLVAALVPQWPAAADSHADFRAAVEDASARCRLALQILETEGQQETAAAVHSFRQAWQLVMERYAAVGTPASAQDTFLDVDVRIIGVLLIIDLGNRGAARTALEAIDDIVSELSARPFPPER